MVVVNAASIFAQFSSAVVVLAATIPHPPILSLSGSGMDVAANSSMASNSTPSSALGILPPDPSTFEILDFPNMILRLSKYGNSLGIAGVNDAAIDNAIVAAEAHSPSSGFASACTYVENHVQIRVIGSKKITWGEWTAAAIVLKRFVSVYEFVALDFDIIEIVHGNVLLTGFLERVLW